jgi:hypothetical protein
MNRLFLFLTVTCPISLFAADNIPKTNWQLKTEDTYMTIAVVNNRPVVCELKNTRTGWNWINDFSEMPLPQRVKIGNAAFQLDWKYKDGTIEEKNGTSLTLRFFSTNPNLELTSVWQAKPGCGPIENAVSIKNNTGNSITFQYADLISANINLTSDSAITLWNFNKGKYLGKRSPKDFPIVKNFNIKKNDTVSFFESNYANDGFETDYNSELPFQMYDINLRHGLYIGYEWSFGKFVNTTGADPLKINYKAYLWDTSSVKKENGATLKLPAVFFGCYTGDMDNGSNRMKRWFWNHKITPTLKSNPNEPLIEYCIPGNEAQLIEYYKKYQVAEWGAELGKIDIDWLAGAGGDWTKGEFKKYAYWNPDSTKWKSGMTAGDIVHKNKQKLSLYMNFTFEWNDLGTQIGRDKQKNALLTRFDKWHYDYWRSDMMLEAKFDYLSHEGLLEILDYMIANRPNFRYEHCANGGTLKDFTSLQRISMMTNEDSGGPEYHRESFYSCSFMVNPVQLKQI